MSKGRRFVVLVRDERGGVADSPAVRRWNKAGLNKVTRRVAPWMPGLGVVVHVAGAPGGCTDAGQRLPRPRPLRPGPDLRPGHRLGQERPGGRRLRAADPRAHVRVPHRACTATRPGTASAPSSARFSGPSASPTSSPSRPPPQPRRRRVNPERGTGRIRGGETGPNCGCQRADRRRQTTFGALLAAAGAGDAGRVKTTAAGTSREAAWGRGSPHASEAGGGGVPGRDDADGMGMAKDMPLEHRFRGLRVARVVEGPSEVHRWRATARRWGRDRGGGNSGRDLPDVGSGPARGGYPVRNSRGARSGSRLGSAPRGRGGRRGIISSGRRAVRRPRRQNDCARRPAGLRRTPRPRKSST